MLVDGDDRHDYAVLGEMLPVAYDEFFDLLERPGIHAHAPRRHRIAPVRGVFGEFYRLAVFDQENFPGHRAYRMRQRGVPEQLAVFPVNGNEVPRTHKVQQKFLFFLARVPRDVDRSAVIVVVNQRALAEHMVQHAENGFFISGNNARREDHRVPLIESEQPVRIYCDARKGRHRLRLAAAHQDHQFFRRIRPNILCPHYQPVRNAQPVHAVRDLDVVHHAPPNEADLAPGGRRNIHDLLDARYRRGKARYEDLARRRPRQFFYAGPDHPL